MSHHWLFQQMVYLSLAVLLLSGCAVPLLARINHPEEHIKQDAMKIVYHPIGLFHTELTPQTGAPRQGILQPENKGTIEVYPEYQEALLNLEKFCIFPKAGILRSGHPTVHRPSDCSPQGLQTVPTLSD